MKKKYSILKMPSSSKYYINLKFEYGIIITYFTFDRLNDKIINHELKKADYNKLNKYIKQGIFKDNLDLIKLYVVFGDDINDLKIDINILHKHYLLFHQLTHEKKKENKEFLNFNFY